MRHPRISRPALALVLGLGSVISPAEVRAAPRAECPLPDSTSDRTEAERLHRDARSLLDTGDTGKWRKAARLLESSANHRPGCAPETVRALRLAGRLYHAAGDLQASQHALERAARHAMARGDVETAAHCLLDAAQVALDLGRRHDAREAVERARLLALSPELSDRRRKTVLDRVDPEAFRTALQR